VELESRVLRLLSGLVLLFFFYVQLIRFEEAENDCTEALNLDDRYVKAYSRRITARKGLGKLKEAMDGIMCFNPSCFSLCLIVFCVTVDN
jgi:hypothetical protein